MPEDYISKIYAGMNSAYASTGFKLSEQEFRTKLSSDPDYASKVYSGMNSAYASTGFKLTEDEFSGKLGATPKKKVPTTATSAPVQATPASPLASTGGELPSTPGVQLGQGLETSNLPGSQGLLDIVTATGKGFSGQTAVAPTALSGGGLAEGRVVTDVSGLTAPKPSVPVGVHDFGQGAGRAIPRGPQDIAFTQKSIEYAREDILNLETARDSELANISPEDTKNIQSVNDFYDNKINAEKKKIKAAGGLKNEIVLAGRAEAGLKDPDAPEFPKRNPLLGSGLPSSTDKIKESLSFAE